MNSSIDFLLSSIKTIPGLGDQKAKIFERLNIYSKLDLIYHFPVRVEKKLFFPELSNITTGSKVVLAVEILQHMDPKYLRSRRSKIIKIPSSTGKYIIDLIFFNAMPPYILNKLTQQKQIFVSGKIEREGLEKYKIIHPIIHHSLANIAEYEMIYPLTSGLNSKIISEYIKYILANTPPLLEWIPEHILTKYKWQNWYESLIKIHNTKNQADLDPHSKYYARLAFDELFASQLAIKITRKHRTDLSKGERIKFSGALRMNILKEAEFVLTNGQRDAIAVIEKEQGSAKRMMRLLQGDVGSGKTLVALCAMLNVREAEMQSALMAPTEILAYQHYLTIKELVKNRDIVVEILTGKVTKAKRRDILNKLKAKKIHILIGTHALFQADIEFFKLGLVVIDEQHRFGVKQRMELMNKGKNCDVLIMSATPIPRTLAMSVYGDLDITTIKDKPAGRQAVHTLTIAGSREDEVIAFIRKKLELEEQVYWVCPLIESQLDNIDSDSSSAAEDRYIILKKYFGDKVGILHGRMPVEEKEKIMDEFITKKIAILVSTTVIEVGVNVPNATLLVVEKAEKFGLSQLHQLRGRVGRGDKKSHCILLFSNKLSKVSIARLKTLKESEDGFYIAEQDFKIRGGGDILGAKQSGLPSYQIANFAYHTDLLFDASNLANEIIHNAQECNEEYKLLLKLFGYKESNKYLYS